MTVGADIASEQHNGASAAFHGADDDSPLTRKSLQRARQMAALHAWPANAPTPWGRALRITSLRQFGAIG